MAKSKDLIGCWINGVKVKLPRSVYRYLLRCKAIQPRKYTRKPQPHAHARQTGPFPSG